jgi:hypothetical protein
VGSDPYTDGFNTAFTATVAVPAGTLASEIQVFFSTADRFNLNLAECEIRPVSVSITGNTATITGQMIQLIRLNNYLKLAPQPLTATASIYVSTIAVYRQTIDLTASGTLYWYDSPCPAPPCTHTESSACFVPVSVKSGKVAPIPANFDEATQAYQNAYPDAVGGAPNRVTCNYIAGIPRQSNGQVAQPFGRAIALLATALLANKTCGCQVADGIINRYRRPPENDQGQVVVDQGLFNTASAQFGNAGRGAIEAYALLASYEVARNYDNVTA